MDVESVLLSVQERDKWRRRLELLRASLDELRSRRAVVTGRLRRIKRDLRRLGDYSDAVLHQDAHMRGPSTFHASPDTHLSAR